MKGYLAFALFLLTATWLVLFREDAAKPYLASTSQPSALGPEENISPFYGFALFTRLNQGP